MEKLTEQEWRDRESLRLHWAAFCDADATPEGFIERMEAAGFAALRPVRKSDLEESFASERGIERGGMLWELTAKGRAIIDAPSRHDMAAQVNTLGADSLLPDWNPSVPERGRGG